MDRVPVCLDDVELGPDAGAAKVTIPPFIDPQRYLQRLENERISREVRRALDAEQRGKAKPIIGRTLRDRLQDAPPDVQWLIRGWHPAGGRTMLVAKGKGGKTTLIGNLISSLVDGAPFLGEAVVSPLGGSVVLLDTEMSEGQGTLWQRDLGIQRDDRLWTVYLRGNVAAFDLFNPDCLREWAERLRTWECAHLIIDPLKPLMDTFGLDENAEAGRLLVQIDALLAAAGVASATLVHHMGWTAERARGSSRLLDWPDCDLPPVIRHV